MRRVAGSPGPGVIRRYVLRPVLWLLVLLLALAAVLVASLVYQANSMRIGGAEGRALATLMPRPDPSEGITVLLVGTDKREHWVNRRADSIQLLRIYPEDKLAYILSVPRDMRVEIPGRGPDKINYALTYGGPSLLVDTLQNYLGMDINYYVQVDYMGFKHAIDKVGGIVYTVDKGWNSTEFGVNVYPGTRRRMGTEALAILKSRYFAGGDSRRMKNQQQFLAAASKQILGSPIDLVRMVSVMSDYTQTNMGILDAMSLGGSLVGQELKLQAASIPASTGMYNGAAYAWEDRATTERLVNAMKNKRMWISGSD